MTEALNVHGFPQGGEPDFSPPAGRARLVARHEAIGQVVEIAGSGARIEIVSRRLVELAEDPDPSVAMSGQVGSQIKIDSGRRWLLANVRRLQVTDAEAGIISAEIDFLGEGDEDPSSGRLVNFKRGITAYPIPGSKAYPVAGDDLKQMFAADERAHIEIGTVYPTKDVRAALYVDALLGKHFALLGSTGTGKSTSASLIMHRICDMSPEGHIVMIDPHGEYSAAFKGHGELFNVDNLAMPYWLMNFEEHTEVFITTQGADRQQDMDILAKCLLQARAKNRSAEGLTKLTVDSPIPYALSDLTTAITNEMGLLNKATDTAPFMRLKTKIDELKSDPRYQFMFSGMLVADSMGAFISKIFRLPARGKPISIIDVSGVPSDIVSVVVAVLSRLVFDYAIWSRSEVQRPILLICEEAHRYVPADKSSAGQAVRKVLERVAKEGRKYGVSLGLITQRPSDLAEGVLSQCGTIIAMRLNNDRDQQFVKAAMPEGSRGFLDVIPALRNRECIVCGEGVSIPIRVSFDE
ncbi:ATP-binding protein, partial [Sphingosinicella sp.]|uniref:ATP-binding protein n=1 Tax=Sphingosinicella sp. TaxID=1917971 RepID=UPI0040384E52